MKAYITALSDKNYLKGCLVLNESLKQVNSQYPLVVLASKDLDTKTIRTLKKNNIEIVYPKNDLNLPENIIKQNTEADFAYWTKTFIKLLAFDLDEYEKIVLVDNDIIILENIDDLFKKPHMSGVALFKDTMGSKDCSSGFLVIEPQKDFSKNFNSIIEKISNDNKHVGDQDVINQYYPNWFDNKALHLDIDYHIMFGDVWFYYTKFGYGKDKAIKSVHFPGKKKPWMKPITHIEHYIKFVIRKQWILFKIFYKYDKILLKITIKNLFL